jgi:hypothetical protein
MRSALALVVALAALAAACGRTGPSDSVQCTTFQGQPLTTMSCLGLPVATDGLNLCHDPTEAQGHGLVFFCVVSPDGHLYKGAVSSTEWLEGVGWTRSAAWGDASTLSAADEARCAAALGLDPRLCPTNP